MMHVLSRVGRIAPAWKVIPLDDGMVISLEFTHVLWQG